MPARPRILSISFSNLVEDARVLRQVRVLSEYGEVTTLGYGPKPQEAHDHMQVPADLTSLPQTLVGVLRLALHLHSFSELSAPAIRRALELLRNREFDLVVANEARALPLAMAAAGGAPVWGDMHEWAPEERSHLLSWRLLVAPFMRHVCAKHLPRLDAVTTVNGSIADLYHEQFGVRSEVVRNAIAHQSLRPSRTQEGRIRLVHSGGAVPGRNIEALIEATRMLDDRFTLDLYLIPARDGGAYLRRLRKFAADSPRIRFHPAVAPEELPAVLNAYDVGVYLLPPQTTNHRLMLPNKFFDFVQARLGIVFGPAEETNALIEEYCLGLVTENWSTGALVAALAQLTPDQITDFKSNADAAAPELSSGADEAVQRAIITRLLSARSAPATGEQPRPADAAE